MTVRRREEECGKKETSPDAKMQKGIRGGGEKSARFFSGEHHYYITGNPLCKALC